MKKFFAIMLALFAVVAMKAQVIVFQEDFEAPLSASWQNIDNDGDGFTWFQVDSLDKMTAHGGVSCMASESYSNDDALALKPKNWLISPAISVPNVSVGGSSPDILLTWWDAAQDASYPADHYDVYISTTGNTVADFTNPAAFSMTLSSDTWYQRSVNISAYAGQNIYVAFVHQNCTDEFVMKIDDIVVSYDTTASLTLSPTSISFGTVFANVASAIKTVSLAGNMLSEDLAVNVAAPFEFSSDAMSWYTSTTLPKSCQKIYVRMNPTAAGTYSDYLKIATSGMLDSVKLSGTAIEPCSVAPTNFIVTNVSANSVDLSWDNVNNSEFILEIKGFNDASWTVVDHEFVASQYTASIVGDDIYQFRLAQRCLGDTIYSNYVYTICMPKTAFPQAFAHTVYDVYTDFYALDVNDPYNGISLTTDMEYAFAGEFYNDYYYYYDYNTMNFYKVDLTTFNSTKLSTLDSALFDMAYDYSTNTMYAVGLGNKLYTLDLTTGAQTVVGTVKGMQNPYTLAIDLVGKMYSIDAPSGDLYTIDLATDSAILIGKTGVGANYIQSMSFNHNDGLLYWAQYESSSNLYVVNTNDATVNNLGTLCYDYEIGTLTFPYTYNPDAPGAPVLTVVPDTNFNMSADVTVVVVPNNVIGDPYTGTFDSVIVVRDGEVIYVETVHTTPGDIITFTDNDTNLTCGYHTYETYAVNAEGMSQIASQKVVIGNVCYLVFNMNDQYGDGWEGSAIEVYLDGELYATLTCEGQSAVEKLVVCDGAAVELKWFDASPEYPEEISFVVTDEYDQQEYAYCNEYEAGDYVDGQVLASFTQVCMGEPTCYKPTAMTLVSYSDVDATITWTDELNSAWIIEYGVSGFTPGTGTTATATDTTFTLTGLTANTEYEVYVKADCGAEDGISAAISGTFLTDVCAASDKCAITVEMSDAGGDGWMEAFWFWTFYGYLFFTSDDQEIDGAAILDAVASQTATIDLCENSEIKVYWYEYGELSDEAKAEISFKIYDGQHNLVKEVANGTSLQSGAVIATFTNKCGVGVEENAERENAIDIYPNPVKDVLNVRAEGFNTVEVVNFLGQTVYSASVNSSEFTINTSNLTAGVYFIRLAGDNLVTKKFVKE
ncbi:MAG: choice-of-anchor J domain-containing protein [Bacteroidales bacterium]|nr:choice-of-anchor J domain-containing protein [Bacteroidales bacterium]